ncbi:hypothetical protein [Winogradskyella sp. A2]|uniref:hypothetical protein n=1 Tax=Winogradskyella sp. A2 TaxID=3366944 RepID=UPI00398C7CD8
MIKTTFTSFSSFIFIFLITLCGNSQNGSDIFESYENYVDAPREVVYLHLNKSTYIKGENIGFTAYVLDKKEKTPSLITTNLYVSISDKNNNEVKQQLVKVTNGVASNVVKVDSLFTSGIYNVKAYTNYMRNFNEPNYYSEAIKIIDPEVETYIESSLVENDIDAQFLPESGHLLHGIINNVGVVIKDSQGFGLPNIAGEVMDNNNEIVSTFKTNKLGLGKFPLMANIENTYTVKIKYANEDFSFPLGHVVEKTGIVLSIKRLKTKLFASVITNNQTLDLIRNNRYTLMLHNGDGYEIMDIYFTDNTTVTKAIEYENIPVGTNILTLFNEDEKPVAERLFFNYNTVNPLSSNTITANRKGDSVSVKLNYRNIDPNQFNNLSVSILPTESKAYNRHNNILSQTFLQPYIKGSVENGKYYFENIDDKKRYDLDNLLLTQGWSSYDWNNLFLPEILPFPFEQGISVKANVNNPDHKKDVFVLHHFDDSEPRYKKPTEGDNSFIFENLFPDETNRILISRLKEDNNMVPAQLYLQPVPNVIPRLNQFTKPIQPKFGYNISDKLKVAAPMAENFDKIQELEEVVVTSKLEKQRVKTRKLNEHSYGRTKVITQMDRFTYNTLEQYLAFNRITLGLNPLTNEAAYFSSRGNRGPVAVFLDGIPLLNLDILSTYTLADVDRVDINLGGLGEGFRGLNGAVRIYSSQKSFFDNSNRKTAENYLLPLTFSAKKKYYVPKYSSYYDAFYKGYGTIDWKPELKVDEQGNLTFKIKRPTTPIKLHIEGIANDGMFVVEKKSVSIN